MTFSKDERARHTILIYGDIDMNIIDGSSIWVTSVISVLNRPEVVSIDLLLKRPLTRDLLLSGLLASGSVRVIDPFQLYGESLSTESMKERRLTTLDAAKIIDLVVRESSPNVVLVRGHAVNILLSSKEWSGERLVPYMIWTRSETEEAKKRNEIDIRQIVQHSLRLMVTDRGDGAPSDRQWCHATEHRGPSPNDTGRR